MDAAEALQTALSTKHKLEALLDSPAWRMIVAEQELLFDELQKEVLFTPCASVDSTLAQEYKKGRLAGMQAFANCIQGMLNTCEYDVKNSQLRLEQENDNGTSGSTDGNSPGGYYAP